MKAIFLDRDGVIIHEDGNYTFKIEKVKLVPKIYAFLKSLHNKGYLIIVISNQGGIAKKIYTKSQTNEIHAFIEKRIGKKWIKAWYYCPHHNEVENCICRKPDSALYEKAIAKYKIDVTKSYMIGDKQRDIDAAKKVGINGILVESNELSPLFEIDFP